MKKIYSYVLMAAMLLIGTNAWSKTWSVGNTGELEEAWAKAETNDIIQLSANVNIEKSLWLGTITMDGTPRSITLDLNGNKLISDGTLQKVFFLSHGELNVITSVAGGEIVHGEINPDVYSSSYEIFRVTGSTYKTVNPKTVESGYYTHLTIGSGVTLTAKSIAVTIDQIASWPVNVASTVAQEGVTMQTTFPSALSTKVYPKRSKGVANGVRVDVYGSIKAGKYAFKSNGNLGCPSDKRDGDNLSSFKDAPESESDYVILDNDTAYSPFIHIYNTASMWVQADNNSTPNDPKKPVAVYCSGYARWLIEGSCTGSTGVYVKSGDVDIHDAKITSTYTGTYTPPTGTGSGTQGQGSGIVIESSSAYSGEIDVNISGDTHVEASNGYAIDEKVTTAPNSKVDGLTISGGTFVGGTVPDGNGGTMQGTISISETTAGEVESGNTAIVVAGGSIEGQVTFGNEGDLGDIVDSESSYATTVTDPETGQQTVIIKPGTAPIPVPNDFNINSFAGGDVNLSDEALTIKDQVFNSALTKMYINTLEINPPTSTVTLTITAGKTIQAKNVTLGGNGKIIVEPGAQLIVSGGAGITTIVPENLVLQTSASQQAKFLIDPAIESNRHPKATVEFVSTRAFAESPENYQSERFAIPTWGAITSIECTTPGLVTNIQLFDSKGWKNLGNLTGSTFANVSQLNRPFAAYTLLPNNGSATPTNATYRFTGELTGNMDANLSLDHEWTPFANSYSANLDVYELMSAIPAETPITTAVYVHKSQGGGRYYWGAIDEEWFDGEKLAPLQPFILHNESMTIQESAVNYNDMVWSPGTSAGAPARRTAKSSNSAKLRIVISDIQGECDEVKMTESATNSNAPKYMNDDVNFFAHVGEYNLSIVAAEDLEGTYFGFSTVKGGEFTINFTNVEGREFDLLDLDTNIATAVEEGNSYTFVAGANTNSDYRFKLVDRRKVATDIDAISAEKSGAQGIYTIMGQYVGEMNLWNTLPAGVYVVDGTKRVK